MAETNCRGWEKPHSDAAIELTEFAIVQVKDTAKMSGSRNGEWGMDSRPVWNTIDANC